MKRPIVQVTLRDASGAVVHAETRAAFNAGVRASEAAVRKVALSERDVYEGDRPSRIGDVYTRRWISRGGRVLTATVAKESEESRLRREFGPEFSPQRHEAGRNPVVEDALGRRREAKEYPDASYTCPFCAAAVMAGSPAHAAGKCPNPACFARGGAGMPAYPPDKAREVLEREEQRKREEAERQRNVEFSRQYREDSRRREEERLETVRREALARAACVRCAVESARYGRTPKYTRHRKGCPHDRYRA